MDYLQQCGAKKVPQKIKWATTNHSKNWSTSKDWKGIVMMTPSANQTLNSDKYYSLLGWLKVAINENCPESANQKGVCIHYYFSGSFIFKVRISLASSCINWNLNGDWYMNTTVSFFHQDNTRPHAILQTWKKLVQSDYHILIPANFS